MTKANLHLVPDEYVRKQTMTNAERFYTEELRQKEKEIVNAEERAVARSRSFSLRLWNRPCSMPIPLPVRQRFSPR